MEMMLSLWTTYSCGMTASAPSGTTPPVAIAIASPVASARAAGAPAAIQSTTGSVPGVSATRTAKPSIDERDRVLRENAPGRLGQWNTLRRKPRRSRQDQRKCLLEGEQVRHPAYATPAASPL